MFRFTLAIVFALIVASVADATPGRNRGRARNQNQNRALQQAIAKEVARQNGLQNRNVGRNNRQAQLAQLAEIDRIRRDQALRDFNRRVFLRNSLFFNPFGVRAAFNPFISRSILFDAQRGNRRLSIGFGF